MERLAETGERIAATTKKSKKVAILAEYFRSRELADAMRSAVFLSGRAFPLLRNAHCRWGGAAVEIVSG